RQCSEIHFDIAAAVRQNSAMAKPALGRGLGALLGGAPAKPAPLPSSNIIAQAPIPPGERVRHVALDRVRPCAFQPRKEFSAETLQELADSIKQQGILQPLIVRDAQSHFE